MKGRPGALASFVWLVLGIAVAFSALGGAGPAAGLAEAAPDKPIRLRIPFPADDGSLTPYTFEAGYSLMTLVYDTLMWRDATGVPKPWLASAVETSADGRQITARLSPGARWHDGRPLTSADVAFSFEFIAANPHPRFTGQLNSVERVETPDPATVLIRLTRPSPGFFDQPLSDVPIIPKHLWENLPRGQFAPGGLPIGSGPFRLVGHNPQKGYRFQANVQYFRGRPAVDEIEMPLVESAEETLSAFENRKLDMIPVSLPRNAAANIDDLAVTIRRGDSYFGTTLMFNLRATPFDNQQIRNAVSRVLDPRRILRNAANGVSAEKGVLHPASEFAPAEDVHVTDLEAARKVLSGKGLSLEILAPATEPIRLEAGRQVTLALERVGVKALLKALPSKELSKAVGEDGSEPDYQAAIWAVPKLVSYDPSFMGRIFGSDPKQAQLNFSGYSSMQFDQLADRVDAASDKAARRSLVADQMRLLAADAPTVPLFFAEGAYAYRPAIYDGWVYVKGSGILDKQSFFHRPSAAEMSGETTEGVSPKWIFAGIAGVLVVIAGALASTAIRRGRTPRPG